MTPKKKKTPKLLEEKKNNFNKVAGYKKSIYENQ
jgi:hypothetical protein